MSFRSRFALLAIVLAGCALVAPAHAGDDPVLTIRTTSSGWVDVKIPKPFTLDSAKPVDWTRSAHYVGYYAEPVGQAYSPANEYASQGAAFGYVVWHAGPRVAALNYYKGIGVTAGSTTQYGNDYPAGTYRFHVLTDRPATLVLDLPGLAKSATVRVTHRSRLRVSTSATVTVPVNGSGAVRTPFTVSARSVTWALYTIPEYVGTYHTGTDCIAAATNDACTDDTWLIGSDGSRADGYGVLSEAGKLANGSYEGYQSVQRIDKSGGTPTTLTGLVLSLETPA